MTTETITETPTETGTLHRELAILVRHPGLLTTGSVSLHHGAIWLQYTSSDVADWVIANADEHTGYDNTHDNGTRYATGAINGIHVTAVVEAVA